MAAIRAIRPKVGSVSWITEERHSAQQIVLSETEEFLYSARNEIDWLNEHMAEIFNGKQVNLAEILKTPGKLRGKTPRTIRKNHLVQERPPLLKIFSASKDRPTVFKPLNTTENLPTLDVAKDSMSEESAPEISDIENKPSPTTPKTCTNELCLVENNSNEQKRYRYLSPQLNKQTHSAHNIDENGNEIENLSQECDYSIHACSSFPSPEQEQSRKTHLTPFVEAQPIVNFEDHELEISQRQLYPSLGSTNLLEQSLNLSQTSTPQKKSPQTQNSVSLLATQDQRSTAPQIQPLVENQTTEVNSPSEASSPMRPMVRKSSLNFASLPAREPITTKKSLGNRVSRLSQPDYSRTSHYARKTSESCMASAVNGENYDTLETIQIGNDSFCDDTKSNVTRLHNKTSTQRLQDQISKLGQSQKKFRPSKSFTGSNVGQVSVSQLSQQVHTAPLTRLDQISPICRSKLTVEELCQDVSTADSSFNTPAEPEILNSQLVAPPQNNSVNENLCTDEEIKNGPQNRNLPSLAQQALDIPLDHEFTAFHPANSTTANHVKSSSTSDLSLRKYNISSLHNKEFSVSNLENLVALSPEDKFNTLPKSSLRNHHASPLKAAKDKFSMILKSSKYLFATSAISGAELTSSSASSAYPELQAKIGDQSNNSNSDALEPSTSHYDEASENEEPHSLSNFMDSSSKTIPRRSRASMEREIRREDEEVRNERSAGETAVALRAGSQLENTCAKNAEEIYLNNPKQKRAAPAQEKISKVTENPVIRKHDDLMHANRMSPKKTKVQLENEKNKAAIDENQDIEMVDSSHGIPPPILRTKAQTARSTSKRPLKPARETTKAKPPTVIRVDTGSQRGHQYHPSNATLSATLKESLSTKPTVASHRLRNRTSTSSAQSKSSTNSFKAAATKTLEAAARKKEQDELAAIRKREAKLELERQRAMIRDEERRKEDKRRQEIEHQREREKLIANAEIKKTTSRNATEKRRLELEKAKEIRPPQPYVRDKTIVDLEKAPSIISGSETTYQSKTPANIQKVQQDQARPITSSIISNARVPPKRPLLQENEDHHLRPTIQRSATLNQRNEQQMKRHKTNDFDDDEEMMKNRSKMTAPPIRQSSIRQKEIPTKSLFPNGYINAAPPANLQRSTLISQHHTNQPKVTHPMDMIQLTKGPIPFASSFNQANSQTHKTPARLSASNSGGKSTTKPGLKTAATSSPKYPNGETIELPEIHTDSDDEDSENEGCTGVRPGWTDTPEIQKQLAYQESIDPAQVFGQPGPLNMEEVFSKSKDRFHKFRARTSSANWSGTDKLTEDEIQRDLEGRNRVRRQGGWTYDAMV
ncbi:hypothetical protein K3495_g1317 [Podosphaera aphanis]|nr:hypothetical protein K3495_g1317 [Podosphaera aphanis]